MIRVLPACLCLLAGLGACRSPSPGADGFAPTVENPRDTTRRPPPGMVMVPGGEFSMGAADPRQGVGGHEDMKDARPIHRVFVSGFWMDATTVTNSRFERFVAATGYVTLAERVPDVPGVPADALVPGGAVFTPPGAEVPLDDYTRWWTYVPHAEWRHPRGPRSTARPEDPVVQVTYADAVSFCTWSGGRLPTEAEWEFAARGGLAGRLFVWGDSLRPEGRHMANIFEGHFPDRDSGEDGFRGIAPVAQFPPNAYGLYDMAGNVWQWTSDLYSPDTYMERASTLRVARNPKGPTAAFDPQEPKARKRVQRGGSFLCSDAYCVRYVLGTRGRGEESSPAENVGFRCVRDFGTSRDTPPP